MNAFKARLRRAAQQSYGLFLRVAQNLLGPDQTKILDARLRFHRKLNLKNPQTLADKVSYLSIHGLPPLASTCTDKWAVRDYVASKGLSDILIPVYGTAVERAQDVDFDRLPERFVLKATHGCRMNYICTDKTRLDLAQCRKTMDRWLRTTYGTYSMEPHYRTIPHRVYCETFLAPPEDLVDYKIHCIHGTPTFILACSQRGGAAGQASSVAMRLYDPQWKPIDGLRSFGGHVPGSGLIPRPERLSQMLEVAKTLSADFDFVRVDLYQVDGKVYFGELTFTPANGVFASYQDWLLENQGKMLHLRPKNI